MDEEFKCPCGRTLRYIEPPGTPVRGAECECRLGHVAIRKPDGSYETLTVKTVSTVTNH